MSVFKYNCWVSKRFVCRSFYFRIWLLHLTETWSSWSPVTFPQYCHESKIPTCVEEMSKSSRQIAMKLAERGHAPLQMTYKCWHHVALLLCHPQAERFFLQTFANPGGSLPTQLLNTSNPLKAMNPITCSLGPPADRVKTQQDICCPESLQKAFETYRKFIFPARLQVLNRSKSNVVTFSWPVTPVINSNTVNYPDQLP